MRKLFALAVLAFLFAPVAARAADDKVYKVGGDVSAPVPIERSEPDYTQAARDERVEGSVKVSAIVNAEGRTENIQVVRKLHPDLDKNAVDAVKTWRFKPAMKEGKRVKAVVNIEINFRLS
jgi:protein TonB